jgi:hypothetical protein
MFGSHEIKRHEFEELSRGQPEAIIVGTGTDGAAHVAPKAQRWTAGKSLDLLIQPPCQAGVKLNEVSRQRKTVAALIQITC